MASASAEARIWELLRDCSPGRGVSAETGVLFTVESEPLPTSALAGLLSSFETATLYRPNENSVVLAVGSAQTFSASGPGRFARIRDEASAALLSYRCQATDGVRAQEPRVYGGFAFQSAVQAPVWQPFGAASFTLPRLRYESNSSSATISLTILPQELAHEPTLRTLLGEALEFRESVRGCRNINSGALSNQPKPLELTSQDTARADYEEQVRAILEAIGTGAVQKVVAARQTHLRFPRVVDEVATVCALEQQNKESTTFCFKRGPAAFVGATPETLVRKEGRHLWSEALAGTFRLQSTEFAAELLRSPKEHAEHAPVLEAIVSALAPFCESIQYPDKPDIRTLRHMLHLLTPIEAQLTPGHHVLDILEALHPTPAVGGVPAPEAQAWIAEHEACDRGWYSGPIGWFDRNGDGEFKVALRSGLLCSCDAYLFAGAGIVSGSVPGDEFRETELKLTGLRASLRVR